MADDLHPVAVDGGTVDLMGAGAFAERARVCVAICTGARRGKDRDVEEPPESEDAEQCHEPGHDGGRDAARPQLGGTDALGRGLDLSMSGSPPHRRARRRDHAMGTARDVRERPPAPFGQ